MSITRLSWRILIAAVALAILSGDLGHASDGPAASLRILPGDFTLDGSAARQRLLVGQFSGEQYVGEVAAGLTLKSDNEKVVKIRDGVAVPTGDGRTTISAVQGANSQHVHVKVTNFEAPPHWSFRNHIEPLMAKSGCSSGACHGALAGKGGFKLSLFGYNPAADHETITRQAHGRRIELADPGRSLILAKPTAAIRHKGGVRFEVDSPQYKMLAEWIAAGAAPPRDDDPRLVRLEVLPSAAVLKPGAVYHLLVRAHFTDGHVEDVTDSVRYASTDESVAKIDQQGLVTVGGYGEGAFTSWYLNRIVIARVTSPYPNAVGPESFASSPRRNFIDELVLKKLEELRLPPSPRAGDAEFMRRAYLDTIGLLPTADEVKAFLADTSSLKRDQLIEGLLARPEFVDYWSYKWSDLLLINGKKLRPDSVKAFYTWVRKQVAANTPWDEFARQVVTAKGSTLENGATNFYLLHQLPEEMTENVSQAFLSLSIGCARCHNHPLEKWTNDQYFAMANLFARVRSKNVDNYRTVYVAQDGELVQPLTGRPQPPTPLDGQPIAFDAPGDRRAVLAQWLTSSDNPYFSRAITNRVWANFFGVGLIEKVDDLRLSNPASNEALMTAAARYLVEQKYDLKALMRTILQSEAYQRSSQPLAENKQESRFYSRYYPRRMSAEVLLDAVDQVTGVSEQFTQVADADGTPTDTKFYPAGTRATQLYDAAVVSRFLKSFGRNEREVTCECARTNEPSIVQVLHLTNGTTINQKLASANGRVSRMLAARVSSEKLLDEIYLTALARSPTPAERSELLKIVSEAPDAEKQLAVEDVCWGILSSREFLFNH